jgi:hypothetical protein
VQNGINGVQAIARTPITKRAGPEDSDPEGSDARRTAAVRNRNLRRNDRKLRRADIVMGGWNRRQNRVRSASWISNLFEGKARLAKLALEELYFVALLRIAGAINVAELMQYRPLLGENQQQRKSQR